ncbi:pyridoxamine 5'-phosphate oxidase family protein [Oceanirhabdus seepicola]|uniref:Pyridoxamine 5'-phosphate oxidase family protein n=1 Tax=Oceanirhabdus seepicola TaxID=2828781 RepID=A0A9J6NZN4_9CLOT|nr:pyridoxamine 5'-phosphate oxidase family protein [Oceanirhabdus seepicola]MCM1989077.1 pyridoxamine 5'-phosphate oxidase family protein [Oceanirhabdus seepicola]
MSKLLDFLNENRQGQFATIKNNKPVMRPFQFVFEKDGKFYFLTSNTKDVYRQLIAAGVAGFAVMGKDMSWARLSGEVQFVDGLELKEEALNTNPLIRGIYKTADNPIFEMFYIHRGEASLHRGAGELIEEMEI